MIMTTKLWQRLRDRKYRKAFAADQLKRTVPFQIQTIRKARGWSQDRLAKKSGLSQGVISRAEDMNYGNLTFNTVVEIAAGFDLAFIGKFVPFSELEREHHRLSEESLHRLRTFEEEDRLREQRHIEYSYPVLNPQDPLLEALAVLEAQQEHITACHAAMGEAYGVIRNHAPTNDEACRVRMRLQDVTNNFECENRTDDLETKLATAKRAIEDAPHGC